MLLEVKEVMAGLQPETDNNPQYVGQQLEGKCDVKGNIKA